MEKVIITIPERSILLNQLLKMHWREKVRHRNAIAWQMRAALPPAIKGRPPINTFDLHVMRFGYHRARQLPDLDGLKGGLKYYIDTLCEQRVNNPYGLGVVVDDGPDHMLSFTAEARAVQKDEPQFTRFIITPVV